MSLDLESEIMFRGLDDLALLDQSARRRVLAYWCARAESLPLKDRNGEVLEERPLETEPPILQFIHQRQHGEADA